jgi:hypothetical protein
MKHDRYIKTALLFVVLVTFIGCKSKQEKPGASAGGAQEKAATTAGAPQGKSGADAVPPQDKADARASAARVLAQMEAGDFSAIYKESAPGFKQIGSESQFVAKFQHTRLRVGALKNPHELSFDTRPDKSYVLVYRVENERFKTDMRLSFLRAQNGKMELVGLNQHDEPKK